MEKLRHCSVCSDVPPVMIEQKVIEIDGSPT